MQAQMLRTALILDDDEDVRLLLGKLLKGKGFRILEATTIERAIEIVKEDPPHLALVDIKLGNDEYGFSFIQKLHKLDLKKIISVIIISSLSNQKATDTAKQFGIDAYLVKPIKNTELFSILKKNEAKLNYPNYNFFEIDDLEKDNLFQLDDPKLKLNSNLLAELTKINEMSCVISSKVKFQENQEIKVHSKLFNDIGIDGKKVRISKASHDGEPGNYVTTIQILGLSEIVLTNIRKLHINKA